MDNDEEMGWFAGEYRSRKGISISEVVKEWSEGSGELLYDLELCKEAPEIVWAAILEILPREITDEQKALLAAGPLEALLSFHGDTFIDRVEQQAQENARFNHLLGGVWQFQMPREIWERVQRARKVVW